MASNNSTALLPTTIIIIIKNTILLQFRPISTMFIILACRKEEAEVGRLEKRERVGGRRERVKERRREGGGRERNVNILYTFLYMDTQVEGS